MTQGETDLKILLATMQPSLHETAYVFCSLDQAAFDALACEPRGVFREQEGISVILTQPEAEAQGLAFEALWACITLMAHSSLSAVGFLAAITTRLAQAGISANPVSAFYHDHLFVPWESRQRALRELVELSQG
jgi:hypothetical protein